MFYNGLGMAVAIEDTSKGATVWTSAWLIARDDVRILHMMFKAEPAHFDLKTRDPQTQLDFKKPSSVKKWFSFKDPPTTANMQAVRNIIPKSGGWCRLVG